MANPELTLRFPGPSQVEVVFDGTGSGLLPFTNPVSERDHTDILWYVETYGAASLADPDDQEAARRPVCVRPLSGQRRPTPCPHHRHRELANAR